MLLQGPAVPATALGIVEGERGLISGLILCMVAANFLSFMVFVFRRRQPELFRKSVPQVVLFGALMALLYIGL